MKKAWVYAALLLLSASLLPAQDGRLARQDMDRFITTFPEIMDDLNALGLRLEKTANTAVLPAAAGASLETKRIFLSRGWDENFMEKIQVILNGYFLTAAEAELLSAAPDIQQALREIDETPVNAYFTAEMKKQARDMILAAYKSMNQALYAQLDAMNPSDLDLIRANKDRLSTVLDNQ